ncbi:MAG: bis-aminopropyl spermidine synthase family protein [Pseudomonadota bacterium]
MLTYADGVHVNLDLHGKDSVAASVQSFGKAEISPADRDILVPLMFGLDPAQVDDPRLAPLRRLGFLADKPSGDDPVLEQRLDAMAAKWAWQRPGGREGQRFQRVYGPTLRAHARRKIFVQAYGQTPVMPETAVRRALLLGSRPLEVLCIGDDDLLSVPLALLGHRVTVYDIDEAVLIPFLRGLAREWKLDIQVEKVDLTQPQPRRKPRFDAVVSDPMSTRECFDLFLSRGLALLKTGGTCLCAMHAYAVEIFEAVQRDMRFAVRARHHDFNHYYEEGFWENYYRSDLIEIEKVRETRPVYALDQAAPLDLTSSELDVRHHQACDLRGFDPARFSLDGVDGAIDTLKQHSLIEVIVETRHRDERTLSYAAALGSGGTFALTAFADEMLVAYDLYPFQPARDQAIREVLLRAVPQSFHKMIYRSARPHQPSIGPEAPVKRRPKKR